MNSQPVTIEFEIEEPLLISINEQYIHPVRKTKRGTYVSYFAKSDYLKRVQAFYKEKLAEKITDEDIEKMKDTLKDRVDGFELSIIVGLPSKELNEHDISNFVKAVEDCIVSRTGVDDSRHHRVVAEKRIYENEGKWIVKIALTQMRACGFRAV